MRELIEWHDYVCGILEDALTRAQPTGSSVKPLAICSFSKELIEEMLRKAPLQRKKP